MEDLTLPLSIHDLLPFVGTWEGFGHAQYPTIQPVDYLEELVLRSNKKDPVIHFEQRTWVASPEKVIPTPIFWESGFFIDKGNELFELVSAQKSGRMEILRGKARKGDDGTISLSFSSALISNDDRMVRSGRVYSFSKERIQYELSMSTTANRSYERHIAAQLTRSRNAP